MKKRILVGDAWPYVNGNLHIGHIAGHMLAVDIFARYNRSVGNEVLMVSGSDCYGTPITVEADKRGISPQEIVLEYHEKLLALIKQYDFSYDLFTKTTTDNHTKVTQDIFVALAQKGYLSIKTTPQYFDEKARKFLPDRYVEGKCGYCGYDEARSDQCDNCGKLLDIAHLTNPLNKLTKQTVTLKDTQHYYLDLPKFSDFLHDFVSKRGKSWRSWIREETNGWLKKGLEPRAITRDLNWGIPIPVERLPENLQIKNVEDKRIYVWFDAVVGYLSASIEWSNGSNDWKKFWYPTDEIPTEHWYFMGKDNLVFHTLFWPSQLYGYDEAIHLPDNYCINQYLNFAGQKFSKSRGIVVDSREIAEKYGTDAVRWYLASIMPENSDANFSWDDFFRFHNDVLVGTFSNFIHRVLSLAHAHKIKPGEFSSTIKKQLSTVSLAVSHHISHIEFKLYVQDLLGLASFGNKYIDAESPWKLDKSSSEFRISIQNGLAIVATLGELAYPLAPAMSEKIKMMLSSITKQKPEPLFRTIEHNA